MRKVEVRALDEGLVGALLAVVDLLEGDISRLTKHMDDLKTILQAVLREV